MSELLCNVHIETRPLTEAMARGTSYTHRVACSANRRKGNWTSELHAYDLLAQHRCNGANNPNKPR